MVLSNVFVNTNNTSDDCSFGYHTSGLFCCISNNFWAVFFAFSSTSSDDVCSISANNRQDVTGYNLAEDVGEYSRWFSSEPMSGVTAIILMEQKIIAYCVVIGFPLFLCVEYLDHDNKKVLMCNRRRYRELFECCVSLTIL